MHTKTARARGKVRAQYRWAYATSTLILLQENGQNQHEKGGWAFNTSWAYNTYSTVYTEGVLALQRSGLTAVDFFNSVDDTYGIDEECLSSTTSVPVPAV